MENRGDNFDSIVNTISYYLDDISALYKPADDKLRNAFASSVKSLFDYGQKHSINGTRSGTARLLHVKGFDEEQIWSQIQEDQQMSFSLLQSKLESVKEDVSNEDFSLVQEGFVSLPLEDEREAQSPGEEQSGVTQSSLVKQLGQPSLIDKLGQPSLMDKLGQPSLMEQPISTAMEKKNKPSVTTGVDKSSEERDFFEPPIENIHVFIDKMENDLDALEDDPQDPVTDEDDKIARELYGDDDQDEDEEEDHNDQEVGAGRSEFEEHQEQLLEDMEQLERDNLEQKPWQLGGEVESRQRPQNSLLQEELTFDHTMRARPIISEQHTSDLESIIISRIVAGIFDDPHAPDEKQQADTIRGTIELKHEQSKKSLAEIYEHEYMKRVEGVSGSSLDGDDQESHQVQANKAAVRHQVAKMLHLLNTMSSTVHVSAPEAPQTASASNSNAPAINIEESIPTGVSTAATVQAPHEIMRPIATLMPGDSEKSSEDRSRKRRRAKEVAKQKTKKARDLVEKINPGKYHKEKMVEELQKKAAQQSANNPEQQVNTKFTRSKVFFNMVQQNLDKYARGNKKQSQESNNATPQHDDEHQKTKRYSKKL